MLIKKVLSSIWREYDKSLVKTSVCDALTKQNITMRCKGNDDQELGFCRHFYTSLIESFDCLSFKLRAFRNISYSLILQGIDLQDNSWWKIVLNSTVPFKLKIYILIIVNIFVCCLYTFILSKTGEHYYKKSLFFS